MGTPQTDRAPRARHGRAEGSHDSAPCAVRLPAGSSPAGSRPPSTIRRLESPAFDRAIAPANALRVLHADDALIVVDKPAGLLCVPGRGPQGADCLARRVQACWPDALVVHRLDMATSGLVAFARGEAAQRRLGMAFAARAVDKRYVAVVAGLPAAPGGAGDGGWAEIALPLAADWPRRPRQRIAPEGGKPSLTRWRVLAHDAATATTRLELRPVTGRTHQLRVHLLALGHPIVGDALYGPSAQAVEVSAGAACATGATPLPRLWLHATRLAFAHPAGGEPVAFASDAPF